MLTLRRSEERGHLEFGWLDTRHSFAFGQWNPAPGLAHGHGFRALRVINEDIVAPAKGFDEHPHADMEIITYILSGELSHRDSLGSVRSLGPGDVQRMTAGTGIRHAEFNASRTAPVHLLQIWLRPASRGAAPAYGQTHFDEASRRDRLRVIASSDARDGSLSINQDASVYASLLSAGRSVAHPLAPGRHAWLQVARGAVDLNGTALEAGDGAAVSEEKELKISARQDAEFLLFDLA